MTEELPGDDGSNRPSTPQDEPSDEPAPRPAGDPERIIPDRSSEDSDAGWGERPDDDDERLLRDVPPHW